MVSSYQPNTKENPSRDNHITGECHETRQRLDKIIQEFHTYFHEEGADKGLWWYLPDEKSTWDEDCAKKHEALEHYENLRAEVEGRWNYIAFRAGFLAGIEYALSGGAVCQ